MALMSTLASCIDPVDDLTRGDDCDALVSADGQQMLSIPGDDQPGPCSHGRRDDVIVIGIVGEDARYAAVADGCWSRPSTRPAQPSLGDDGRSDRATRRPVFATPGDLVATD